MGSWRMLKAKWSEPAGDVPPIVVDKIEKQKKNEYYDSYTNATLL